MSLGPASILLPNRQRPRPGTSRTTKIPLTDLGWKQARETGLYLRDHFGKFDVAYHSDYQRTFHTLTGLLEAYPPDGKPIVNHSHLLRERERGYTYRMTQQEVDQKFPYLQAHYDTFGYFYFRPPGGQNYADVCSQLFMFLKLRDFYAGKKES